MFKNANRGFPIIKSQLPLKHLLQNLVNQMKMIQDICEKKHPTQAPRVKQRQSRASRTEDNLKKLSDKVKSNFKEQ